MLSLTLAKFTLTAYFYPVFKKSAELGNQCGFVEANTPYFFTFYALILA